MKRVFLLGLLLAGCTQRHELGTEPIALLYAAQEASKTDALTVGDEVTVYASVDGTQHYFLNAHRFVAGSDGRTLTAQPAVFYPDAKQAVAFYAWFGSQSVPSDQSTPADLKKADLCWASASSTPNLVAVPLAFSHVFARLAVTCSAPTSKITIPNAFSGGTLDVRTGTFTNSAKSDVWTAGSELIVPAQTLNRLIITSGGVDYVFDGSIVLENGKTTTVNLTLNTATKTASLAGSSVAAWTAQEATDTPIESVSNVLSLHWPNYLPQSATPDKVVFTIGGADYTVNSGISYANQTFTVPFASSSLRYPYTISKIRFYNGSTQSFPVCTQFLGSVVYKSGAATLGIKDQANAIKIGSLWWATGNLVATGLRGAGGKGALRIGAPMDGGLYFQFGSLIGYKGGNQANGGNGVGAPQVPGSLTPDDHWYWGGASWTWVGESYVWPIEMGANPTGVTAWQNDNGAVEGDRPSLTGWYFKYNATPYSTAYQNIVPWVNNAANAANGIGDPCTYYLDASWRLPTTAELAALTGKTGSSWITWAEGITGRWVTASQTFAGITGPGVWLGAGLSPGAGTPDVTKNLFFPASSCRYFTTGAQYGIGVNVRYGSSSIASPTYACNLDVNDVFGTIPQNHGNRSNGFPIRCVSAAP